MPLHLCRRRPAAGQRAARAESDNTDTIRADAWPSLQPEHSPGPRHFHIHQ